MRVMVGNIDTLACLMFGIGSMVAYHNELVTFPQFLSGIAHFIIYLATAFFLLKGDQEKPEKTAK